MALTYSDFTAYPIKISGISASYNSKITAVETFVIDDMEYSGEASDVSAILKYFVFWYFCQDLLTTMSVQAGGSAQVKEFSVPDVSKQVLAWDIGAEKLKTICEENQTTVKSKYLRTCNPWL